MPTFPTYDGPPLPKQLNPLDPRHWLLVLDWVFFHPSRLKQYLYRADPTLYRQSGWSMKVLRQPAYRSLLLTSLVVTSMLPLLFWAAGELAGRPVNWRGVAVGVAFVVASGVAFGVAGGVAVGIGGLLGSLQLPAYCIEFCAVLWASPLYNEWGVLPLPNSLTNRLFLPRQANPGQVGSATQLLRNSFRAHTVFRWLNQYLQENTAPLGCLYGWLVAPQALHYVIEPLAASDFRHMPSLRRVLLGGVAGQFVDRTGGPYRLFEQWAWYCARWLYRSAPTHPLIGLARLLLNLDQLTDDPIAIAEQRKPIISQIDALPALHVLPDGPELIDSFTLMAQAWQVASVTAITQLHTPLASLKQTYPTPLRPAVIETLVALGDISRELVDYQQFSTPGAQSATLNRAAGLLNQLATQIEAIQLCEGVLLQAIVRRWQALVATEAGQLGDRVLREMGGGARQALVGGGVRQSVLWQRPALPFPNPYITGRPVQPPLFVGRSAILNRIAERWQPTHTPDSIILYGHRRMGKTSIVQNLAAYAPTGSLLVYLDLKGAIVNATQTGDLLLALADKLHAVATQKGYNLPEPQFDDYQQPNNADLHFQRLLRSVLDALPARAFLILALDEFEALETAIETGRLPRAAYNYLRMLSQQPQVTLILAGLHTLDEMSRDYQQAFFASYINVPVSYLTPADAEQLIARPTLEFTLNYDRSVIAEIYRATYGQPLLMQSICSALVNHLNHQLFDLEIEREARILPADLDAVLTDDFLRKESRYFDGIWHDQIAGFADQQAVLRTLAQQATACSINQLATLTQLSRDQVTVALQALTKRDLVAVEHEQWRLLMPLFQRWLQLRAE